MTTLTARPQTRVTPGVTPLVAAAVAAPLLFLVGQAMLPNLPMGITEAFPIMLDHRDQLMAARLFTAAGAFLFVPAAVGIARILPTGVRGQRLLHLGAWLLGIATFSNALSQTVSGYATYTVTDKGFDPEVGRAVVDRIETGLVALPLGFWSIPVFAIGSLLIAVALFRSHQLPTWLPILLAIGTVLAGALAGRGLIVALTQAPFTVAMIALALRIPRDDHAAGA